MEDQIEIHHDDGYPSGFTLVDNRDIWDQPNRSRRLILRPAALGVYVAMRSLPKGWRFHEAWLIEHLGIGRDALRAIVRDLEAATRLTRTVERDERGRYVRTIWRLHRAAAPLTGFPATGNPSMDKSGLNANDGISGDGLPDDGKTHCRTIRTLINKEGASIKKETTTTETELDRLDWSFLSDLIDREKVVVVGLVKDFEVHLQQDLLDELAGARRRKKVFSQSWQAWFRSLCVNAKSGAFELNYGLDIVRDREMRTQAAAELEAKRKEAADLTEKLNSPRSKAIAADAIAAIAAELKPRASRSSGSMRPRP
ncbi:MAG: hypothetical protein NVV60_05795 [Luteimonas sp.]|nr:hypothetical protein [Luteimonas sp.]